MRSVSVSLQLVFNFEAEKRLSILKHFCYAFVVIILNTAAVSCCAHRLINLANIADRIETNVFSTLAVESYKVNLMLTKTGTELTI